MLMRYWLRLGRNSMKMEKRYLSILILLVTAVVVIGCQAGVTAALNSEASVNTVPEATVAATPADDAARISLADAKAAFDAGKALFVDSRAEAAYKAEHIKGAINITGGTLDANLKRLPKDKKIIVYCS